MEAMMESQPRIDFTVQVWREDRHFIAHAMPLDVMSAGPSPETARQALDEAVELFLVTAAEAGTLEEILEETGYRRSGAIWVSPQWVGVEQHSAPLGA